MSFGGITGGNDVNIHNADGTTGREISARVGTVNLSQEDSDALNKIAVETTGTIQQVSQLSDISLLLTQEVGQLSDIQIRVSTEATQLSILQSLAGLSINVDSINLNTDELELLNRVSIATIADGFTQTFDKIKSTTESLQDGLTNIVVVANQQVAQLSQVETNQQDQTVLLSHEISQLSQIITNTGVADIDTRPILNQQVSQLSTIEFYGSQQISQLNDLNVSVVLEVSQLTTIGLYEYEQVAQLTSIDGRLSTVVTQLTTIELYESQQVGQLTQVQNKQDAQTTLLVQEVGQLSQIIANTGVSQVDIRPYLAQEITQLSTLELYGAQQVGQLSNLEVSVSLEVAQLTTIGIYEAQQVSQLTSIDARLSNVVTQMTTLELYGSQEISQLSQIMTNTGSPSIDTRPYLSQEITQLSTLQLYGAQEVSQLSQLLTTPDSDVYLMVQQVNQLTNLNLAVALEVSQLTTVNTTLVQEVAQLSTLNTSSDNQVSLLAQEVSQLSQIISNTGFESAENILVSQQITQLSNLNMAVSVEVGQLTTIQLYESQQVAQLSTLNTSVATASAQAAQIVLSSQEVTELSNLNAAVVLEITQLTTINTTLAQEVAQLSTLNSSNSQQVVNGLTANVLMSQEITQLSNLNAAVALEVSQLTTIQLYESQQVSQLTTIVSSAVIGLTNGQKAMSGSLPVVVAADQTAIPENLTLVNGLTLSALNYLPVRVTDGVGYMEGIVRNNNRYLAVGITQDVETSQSNNSTANLAAGATFTGAGETTVGISGIQINFIASQDCTIQVQQSTDNVNWDIVDSFTPRAGIGDGRTFQAVCLYFRILVTNNGAIATTYLRLLTALCPVVEALPRALTQAGSLKVALQGTSEQVTYSASAPSIASAATATDVFTIYGSATKTIRIMRIAISGSQTTQSIEDVRLIKRSAVNTGGTSALQTAVSHDSTDAAATATVRSYTANPTGLGAAVGTTASYRMMIPAVAPGSSGATTSPPYDLFLALKPDKAITLRGAGEGVAVNFNGVTVTGGNFSYVVEWVEEV
jgi:hypothetical protein